MSDEIRRLIERLDLQPHPEGGWFRETWRDVPEADGRGAGTAVLYLLDAGHRTRWNRDDAAEIWLWHAGGSLLLSIAGTRDGPVETIKLGMNLDAGQLPQAVVPANYWQAAELVEGDFCLISCVVAPAFDFSTYELAPAGWTPSGGSPA